jgi:Zn-dependent protease with chaperone function
MSLPSSLTGRIVLAVGLMFGFYVLAIAIAGALLYLPYAEWTYAGSFHPKLALLCILGSGIILWSILPRPDRFVPPGPMLGPKEHPKLFDALAEIAEATKQQMPSEVYLIPEVNAWVMDRGGIMGYGSRRVMGLGLPLLQVLSVCQLRAVLAHEFGHFHGGDTKLSPWVYKTRAALGRTLQALAAYDSLLEKPFLWYANAFLRMTHAVSRRQEFTADALAVSVAGSRPLIEGLQQSYSAGLAFYAYWTNEVVPVLDRGFHPPLAEGFRHYLESSRVTEMITTSLDRELAEGETNPYDTHPPLRERIAAVQSLPDRETPGADLPALSLLGDIEGLEAHLSAAPSHEPAAQALQRLEWEEVGRMIWVPIWEDYLGKYTKVLAGNTLSTLPELSQNLEAFSDHLREVDSEDLAPEERQRQAPATLGMALAVVLSRNGWKLQVFPGDDVICEWKDAVIKPFDIVPKLASGELTPEAWRELCVDYGIADLDLGAGMVLTQEAASK